MNSFFTIQRKSDDKTDNIYEFDFKNGKFVSATSCYSYDDIKCFIGVPADMIKEIFSKKSPRKSADRVVDAETEEAV